MIALLRLKTVKCAIRGLGLVLPRGVMGVLLCAGCGRYTSPVPPEYSSPKAVEFVSVESVADGVLFTWLAPENDRKGNMLKRLDGYVVLRKELQSPTEAILDERDFKRVSEVPDLTIQRLFDRREAARRGGKPFLRMKLSAEERTVKFKDTSVTPGGIYMYKVAPFNHWLVEGEVAQFVRVIFRSVGSEVTILKRDDVLPDPSSGAFDDANSGDSGVTSGSGNLF